MKKPIFYLMGVAGVFAFAGAAQASLSDATPELTTIQLANLNALPGEPEKPKPHTCYGSVVDDENATTFYCGVCGFIQGHPGEAPMSFCFPKE